MKKKCCRICGRKMTNNICYHCGLKEIEVVEKSQGTIKITQDKLIWSAIAIILLILPLILNSTPAQSLLFQIQQETVRTQVEKEKYNQVKTTLPSSGKKVSQVLTSGNYIVGIHLPEGIYRAVAKTGSCIISIDDQNNDFSIDAHLSASQNSMLTIPYLENIHLYNGAIIKIENVGEINFISDNAQFETQTKLTNNSMIETYNLKSTNIAGIDFATGTYDLKVIKGEHGTIKIDYYDDYHGEMKFTSQIMGLEHNNMATYCNVELPKGTRIIVENVEVSLIPSQFNTLERGGS